MHDSTYYSKLGKDFYKQKNYSEAEKNLKKAIELSPNNGSYFNNLSLIYDEQEKYKEAEQSLKRATELNPANAIYFNNLGLMYSKQNKYKEAEQEFKKATELDSNNASYFNNLSAAYDLQDKYKEAEQELKKATELDPNNAIYFNHLGFIYIKQDKYKEAEQELKRATELDPDNAGYFHKLGMTLLLQNKCIEAEQELKRATELDPNNAIYFNNLGLIYDKQKKYKSAEISIKKAMHLSSNNSLYVFQLLSIFEKQNKNKEYLKCFFDNIKLMYKSFEDINEKFNLLSIEEIEDVTSVIEKQNQSILKLISEFKNLDEATEKKILICILKLRMYITYFKRDLLVKEESKETFYQYTSIRTLSSLLNINDVNHPLKNNINIRLYNTDYMNDPEEGEFLTKILNKHIISNENVEDDQFLKSHYNVSHAFISSLTSESKKDEIPMWSTYGNNSKGVSIGFGNLPYINDNFTKHNTEHLILSDDEFTKNSMGGLKSSNNKFQNTKSYNYTEESVQLYKVAYLNIETPENIRDDNLNNVFSSIKSMYKLKDTISNTIKKIIMIQQS